MNIHLIGALILSLCCLKAEAATIVKVCPLQSSCLNVTERSAVCAYDEEKRCIRKYASTCHLKIASCLQNIEIDDYSETYCLMETYLCEESPEYERWTIFFGHEKDR